MRESSGFGIQNSLGAPSSLKSGMLSGAIKKPQDYQQPFGNTMAPKTPFNSMPEPAMGMTGGNMTMPNLSPMTLQRPGGQQLPQRPPMSQGPQRPERPQFGGMNPRANNPWNRENPGQISGNAQSPMGMPPEILQMLIQQLIQSGNRLRGNESPTIPGLENRNPMQTSMGDPRFRNLM